MLAFVDAFPKSKNLWVIKECPTTTYTALFCGEPQSESWEFVCSASNDELNGADVKQIRLALATHPGYKADFYVKSNVVNIVDVFDKNGKILNHTELVAWCTENSLKLTKIVALEYNNGIPNAPSNTIASLHG